MFGQINYSEHWENGQKIITGVLEGKPLNSSAVYRVKFTGNVNDTIDWGRLSFEILDAGLDYNYQTIDEITVPAID